MRKLDMGRMSPFLAMVAVSGAALAQDTPEILQNGRQLVGSPARYLNRPVSIVDGFCFFDDTKTMTYTCIGNDTPFEVEAPSIPDGPAQNAIKANCGDIQGIEHNPSKYCAFSFKFFATSYKKLIGDYVVKDGVQSDKLIIHFDATSLDPFK